MRPGPLSELFFFYFLSSVKILLLQDFCVLVVS